MDNDNPKFIPVIIILFGVAVGIFIYIWNSSKNPKAVVEEPKQEFERKAEQFGAEILPQGLPTDLPIEDGSVVVSNEIVKVTTPDGKQEEQVVRAYLSAKTVEENLKIYKDYVLAKGWQVSGEINVSKDLMIFLSYDPKNPTQPIKFEFVKNSMTKDVTVRIVLIKNVR